MSDNEILTCPHCHSSLTIDLKAGVIVHHEPPRVEKEKVDLDERIGRLKADHQRAADKMDEAMRRERDRSRLMEDRFAELMKDASKHDDDEKPVRDIDLD